MFAIRTEILICRKMKLKARLLNALTLCLVGTIALMLWVNASVLTLSGEKISLPKQTRSGDNINNFNYRLDNNDILAIQYVMESMWKELSSDTFADVEKYKLRLMNIVNKHKEAVVRDDPEYTEITSDELEVLRKVIVPKQPVYKPVSLMSHHSSDQNLTSWQIFHENIRQYELYQDKKYVDDLLQDLATKPIVEVALQEKGTQLKLRLTLEDGTLALFKPMRFPRDKETLPDHFYFNDYERHNAEIAAFHLDRILGFNRVPPVAGRLVNITKEIQEFAYSPLSGTFFISPAGNKCFYGKCKYYCDSSHAICGQKDMLEGSLMTMINSQVNHQKTLHPWRRSYSKIKKADWETDPGYCDTVRSMPPYNSGRRMLDLMDLAAFDFLTGNLDRHHYEVIKDFGNDSFTLHLDNGRGFGKPRYDDLSILAPINQCCLFRYSTLQKLLRFNAGPLTLGDAMRASLAKDSISPILVESHFTALNRRVRILLWNIYACIQRNKNNFSTVVIDDGF